MGERGWEGVAKELVQEIPESSAEIPRLLIMASSEARFWSLPPSCGLNLNNTHKHEQIFRSNINTLLLNLSSKIKFTGH